MIDFDEHPYRRDCHHAWNPTASSRLIECSCGHTEPADWTWSGTVINGKCQTQHAYPTHPNKARNGYETLGPSACGRSEFNINRPLYQGHTRHCRQCARHVPLPQGATP